MKTHHCDGLHKNVDTEYFTQSEQIYGTDYE